MSKRCLFETLEPLVRAIGGTLADADGTVIVQSGHSQARAVPLEWKGEVVGEVRLPALHTAVGDLMEEAERHFGRPLHELSREEKQQAVAMLDEWGAFVVRKSVEEVAEQLDVSRFTVYNYLNRAETRNVGAQPSAGEETSREKGERA